MLWKKVMAKTRGDASQGDGREPTTSVCKGDHEQGRDYTSDNMMDAQKERHDQYEEFLEHL